MAKITKATKIKSATTNRAGIKSPGVNTGKVDTNKIFQAKRIAKQALIGTTGFSGTGAGSKTAGMMINQMPLSHGASFNHQSLGAYYTSYANGMAQPGGTRDVPPYFVQMNEQNGGILYWPVTLREKYEFYRYFARTDSYCGRAMELLTDLPMSKISLNMPKMEGKPKELKEEIYSFFEGMCDKLNIFEKLQSILWEYNLTGNCFIFHEWNDKQKSWEKMIILPPEEVNIFHYPFSDNAAVEYRPERLIQIIRQMNEAGGGNSGSEQEQNMMQNIYDEIPEDIKNMVNDQGCIVMDTDPYSGSFVSHMARRRSPYMDLGSSVLERVFVPMLMKEHYRYTQLGLASRNMTPKNKIAAPNLTPDELADLRAQVDLSYLDPEFSIVTNYDWDWQQIGAEGRLLDLQGEYEAIENQIFAGLGVTRELLTGEGVYTGTRITVEILNTMFLITREILQSYIEKQLFRPVAEAHGWFETDKHGMKKYFYPKLGFNRLSIRDNQEVFDSLFQLYQKGSMPIDIIYELFNLNTDEIHDKIYKDLFTVKDSVFNRVIEEASSEVGRALVDKTDITRRISRYLNLKNMDEQGQVEDGENEKAADGSPLSPLLKPMKEQGEQQEGQQSNPEAVGDFSDEELNNVAENISNKLTEDDTDEDIEQAVDEVVDQVAPEEESTEKINVEDQDVRDIAEVVTENLGEEPAEEEIEQGVEQVLNQVLPNDKSDKNVNIEKGNKDTVDMEQSDIDDIANGIADNTDGSADQQDLENTISDAVDEVSK